MIGVIYCAKNNINGKCYIGQTTIGLENRVKQHIRCKSNGLFQKALKKYNDWNWYVIQEYSASNKIVLRGMLNKAEVHYVKVYDSYNSGYNMTKGGEGNLGIRFTKEHRDNISRSMIGKKNKCKSFKSAHNRKKVMCVENGIIFDSLKDAAKFIGQNTHHNISACCNGRLAKAGGYNWKYSFV